MTHSNILVNTLRLNMNNPQHVKVNEILGSIDKDVCKSKNQFIVDAIEFYIENFGKEILKKEENDNRYVTFNEIEQLKREMMEAAMTEARREVIRVLGTAFSGLGGVSGVQKAEPVIIKKEDELEDDVLSDLASSWMSEL